MNSTLSLPSADGVVIARSPDNGTYVGRDLSNVPLFQDPSLRTPHGVYYFKSQLDGMQRVSSYQRSDRFPVVILATMQREELLTPWRDPEELPSPACYPFSAWLCSSR